MHNFTLYFKSLVFILIINFITTYTLNAQSDNKEEKRGFSIVIDTPTENIKKIPIIGYKLVYTIYHASLVDFLDKPIEEFDNNLTGIGIKPKNIVIIFTNYEGYKPSVTDPNYSLPTNNTPEGLEKYKTNEGKYLNLKKLSNRFPFALLITQRYVLIGTLIDNNNLFNGNANLKVTNFNIPDATGFSFYKQPNPPEDDNNKNSKDTSSIYSYEELVAQRASMIQYMNLGIFNKTQFIGMMEYKDLINNSYSYFAIPGSLNNLLYHDNKSNTTLGVK